MTTRAILDILLADSAVTALVGERISPAMRAQGEDLPCIVLTQVSVTPTTNLDEPPSLDSNRVQLDAFALTYAQARNVVVACRAALEAGGVALESEFDNFEPDVTEYRITQDYMIWV